MKSLRVVIGSDHAAVALKADVAALLRAAGHKVEEFGARSEEPVDYPDVAGEVARKVAAGGAEFGILCCGTGIGMSIAANKIPGIRASLCHDVTTARLARLHNDANVLCMGGRTTGTETARDIVRTWLSTQYEGGRHTARVEKITALEEAPARRAER